jgi:dCMP deaminase
VTDIWQLVKDCESCTDDSPCAEHEEAVLQDFIANAEPNKQHNTLDEVMEAAIEWARRSPDPATQNSAFLIYNDNRIALETLAVNEFPSGVKESPERWERPTKYSFVEHAERNAIYNAARNGVPTAGMGLVTPWGSCAECARAIIQAGITRLIRYRHDDIEHWNMSIDSAEQMLAEAGVEVITLDTPYPNATPLRRNNGEWLPLG